MNKWIKGFCFLFLLVTCHLFSGSATVNGTVKNKQTNAPIQGASVKAYKNNRLRGSGTTDSNGFYSFTAQPGNGYNIVASADGFQCEVVGAKLRNKKTTTINYKLTPNGGTIAGRVEDTSGNPIANASIKVFLGPFLIATDTTDALGDYSVPNLALGIYVVVATATNYETGLRGAVVVPGHISTVNFKLAGKPGSLAGKVTDAVTSDPIEGAFVQVTKESIVVDSAVTDANGDYRIDSLEPEEYTVVTTADDYQDRTKGAIISSGKVTTVNFPLEPSPGTISGKIVDSSSSAPIPGATVKVFLGTTLISSVMTDTNGEYTVDSLSPDEYVVTASARNYQLSFEGATVIANQNTTVNFSLVKVPGTIKGTVTDATTSDPIGGTFIGVYKGKVFMGSAVTNSDGTYEVASLPPDTYNVFAFSENYRVKLQGAKVRAGKSTTVNFALKPKPGTLIGTVTDSITSDPISGAFIGVFQGTTFILSTRTDPSGKYDINTLAPGNYRVLSIARNYRGKIQGATISANKNTTVDFSLKPRPGSIDGTVIDSTTSSPIIGAVVSVYRGTSLIDTGMTDENGQYRINSLDPGEYRILCLANSYRGKVQGAVVISRKTTTVDFSLQPKPGSITGQVTDSLTSNPIVSATVNVFKGSSLVGSALTDSDGNYTITSLAPDDYTVAAVAIDYQEFRQGATVVSGKATTVNFALEREPGSIAGQVIDDLTSDPLVGAVVNIYQGAILVTTVLTDSNGEYIADFLAPGSYVVQAQATDYQESNRGATVEANQETTVNFALKANPGTLAGQVLDSTTSSPIVGATVEIYQENILIGSVLTDSNGNYLMGSLSPGEYTALAKASDYQEQLLGVTISAGTITTANFALDPNPGSIAGQVLDSTTSSPIVGALVEVFRDSTAVGCALTDSNGNYRVGSLSAGSYVVTATSDGYQKGSQGAIVNTGEETTSNFSLQPNPGNVSGIVIDNISSDPIAGATVQLYRGPIFIDFRVTDNNGRYAFDSIAQGSYIAIAEAQDYQRASQGVIVRSNEKSSANFSLVLDPGTVSGQVTDATNSSPISGAFVQVFKGTALIASAITNENGDYHIESLAPDTYEILTTAENYQSSNQFVSISAGEEETVNFQLNIEPGIIGGMVTESGVIAPVGTGAVFTQTPIPGALVLVIKNEALVGFALTDENGEYLINTLPPDDYLVVALAQTYQLEAQLANVLAGGETIVDFSLNSNPGALEGTVTDFVTKDPLVGALVEVFVGSELISSDLTDENGVYEIESLATGTYSVKASFQNYPSQTSQATVASDEITILNFQLGDIPKPPKDLTGKSINNKYLASKDKVHCISWKKSATKNVVRYRIYRNDQFLGSVKANAPLEFYDHGRNGKTDTYSVEAVNIFGTPSTRISITLQ